MAKRAAPVAASQMSLLGMAPEVPTDRLFFAVMPPPKVAEAIEQQALALRASLGLKGRLRPTSHFHVTLHHLGDWAGLPPDLLAQAQRAGAATQARRVPVAFDRAGSFDNKARNRPFVLRGAGEGVAGLHRLQQALALQMAASGLNRAVEHQFEPHVTLLYDDALVPLQPIEPVCWLVQELVLVHSLLGQTEHRVLGRWRLSE